MKTRQQLEDEARDLSIAANFAVIWKAYPMAGGVRQYRVFRKTGKSVTLIKITADPATLARTMRRETVKAPGARKNPIPEDAVHAAKRRVERFTGRPVDEDEYETVPAPPREKVLARIGKITAIEYIAFRDDKEYRFRHEFRAASRPALAASSDGTTVTMLGGAWKFGDNGFEDH